MTKRMDDIRYFGCTAKDVTVKGAGGLVWINVEDPRGACGIFFEDSVEFNRFADNVEAVRRVMQEESRKVRFQPEESS